MSETVWELFVGRDFDLRVNVTGLDVDDYDRAKAEVRAYPGGEVLATLAIGSGIVKQNTGSLNAYDLQILAGVTEDFPTGILKLDLVAYNIADPSSVKPVAKYTLSVKPTITEV